MGFEHVNIAAAKRHGLVVTNWHVVRDAAGPITAEKHGGKLIFTTQDLWQCQPVFSGTIYFTVTEV